MDDSERKSLTPEEDQAVKDELVRLALDREPLEIHIRKGDAFILISALQLVLRHPNLPDSTRELIGRMVANLGPAFFLYPAMARLIEAGNDPAYDVAPFAAPGPRGDYKISDYDAENVGGIIEGKGNWFGAELIRFIKKYADYSHRRRLAWIYPAHVAAVEAWELGVRPPSPQTAMGTGGKGAQQS